MALRDMDWEVAKEPTTAGEVTRNAFLAPEMASPQTEQVQGGQAHHTTLNPPQQMLQHTAGSHAASNAEQGDMAGLGFAKQCQGMGVCNAATAGQRCLAHEPGVNRVQLYSIMYPPHPYSTSPCTAGGSIVRSSLIYVSLYPNNNHIQRAHVTSICRASH